MESKRSQRAIKLRMRHYNLSRILPNILTLGGLCAGLTSIRFALNQQWELAVIAVVVAAFLDAMDGRVARFLGGGTRFGAELDSLSDFISFGVAPGMILYLKHLQSWGSLGWAVVLFFAACGAMRLARFNTVSIEGDHDPEPWMYKFFTGIPIPMGAILVLSPLMLSFAIGAHDYPTIIDMMWMVVIGTLKISKIPTYSFKSVKVESKNIVFILLGGSLIIAGLITHPWMTLPLLSFFYLLSLPYSAKAFRKAAKL